MSTAPLGAPTTATLDTNVLVEYWKNQNKVDVTRELLRLSDEGEIDLAVTTRIRADIPLAPLAERINELSRIGVETVGTAFRIGRSPIESKDMVVGEQFRALDATIEVDVERQGLTEKRPDWRDVDHLYGHLTSRRDVFLTWDGGILAVRKVLHERHGIVVSTPEDFLRAHRDARYGSRSSAIVVEGEPPRT